jgi:hypothetical protein
LKNTGINLMLPPYEVIQEIRKGYKVDDPSAGMLHEELNSALTALSIELYSDETHFVLELIQNADDNDYGEAVIPKLAFQFKHDRIIVTNNELGFNSDNVWGLCRTGKSTKKGNKLRYTGEKGIGFKSVFVVSDAPEIHSNGYHFRFDRTDKSKMLGYVVPDWIASSPDAVECQTTIILPAPAGISLGDSKLNGLDSRTLLFLRQLKEIEISDNEAERTCSREDNSEITILKTTVRQQGHPHRIEQEFCVRTEFSVDMGSAPDEKRPDLVSTVIVLAFPVEEDRRAKPNIEALLYAFLPIRRAGFRFSIHADFILNSTRQDVIENRPWNRRLLSCISEAFCDAVKIFKKNESLGWSYLEFIPKANEIPDKFFKPVRREIIELLSKSECLLSSGGEWCYPFKLRTADERFRQLFPSPVAREVLGFDYVDARMARDRGLMHELGVKPVLISDVTALFQKHGDWLKAQPKSWISKIYAFIADSQEKFIGEGLLSVASLPLNNGRYVVPNAQEVYFPLGRGRSNYGFEENLHIVDVELFEASRASSKRVDELLRAMKVLSDSPYSMITGHILPKHRNDAWKTVGRKSLIGHLRYIKDNLDDYLKSADSLGRSESEALEILRTSLWVGTKKSSDGWVFNKATSLYISDAYAPMFRFEHLTEVLSAADFVSDEYLPDAEEENILAWRKFLLRLGVHASPKVFRSGADWVCSKELLHLLNARDLELRLSTLLCVSTYWSSYSEKILKSGSAFGSGVARIDSSFIKALRETLVLSANKSLVPVSQAYYPSEEVSDVMGDSVAYVDPKLGKAMLEACLVVYKIDASALIQRLVQLKDDEFDATSEILLKLYRRIEEHFDANEELISTAFRTNNLIRIDKPTKSWRGPADVCWRSSNTFLDLICPPLEGQYKDYSKLFVKQLGVSDSIPSEKLVNALESLSEIDSDDERRRIALSIYKVVDKAIRPKSREEQEIPVWFEKFWSRPLFLSHRGKMVKQGRTLLADDEPQFAKLFEDSVALSFLAVPHESLPALHHFLKAASVDAFSQSASKRLINVNDGVLDDGLTNKLRNSAIHFIRVFYYRIKDHRIFLSAKESGIFTSLQKLEVVVAEVVELEIVLENIRRNTSVDIAREGVRILYRNGAKSIQDKLASELCGFLGAPDELSDMFARILLANTLKEVNDFLEAKKIPLLPSDLVAELEQCLFKTVLIEHDEVGPVGNSTEFLQEPISEKIVHESPIGEADGPSATKCSDYLGNSSSETGPLGMPDISIPIAAAADRLLEVNKNSEMEGFREKVDLSGSNRRPSPIGSASPFSVETRLEEINAFGVITGMERQSGERNLIIQSAKVIINEQQLEAGPYNYFSDGLQVAKDDTVETIEVPPLKIPADAILRVGKGIGKRGKKGNRGGNLMSYVLNNRNSEDDEREPNSEAALAKRRTGDLAVRYFMETQSSRWKTLTEMPHFNPGFDVLAVAHDGEEEFVEVKGQAGAWAETGVALTPRELQESLKRRGRFWLCVVEYVYDDSRRRLYLFQDPFGLANQFRFDSGWKDAAVVINDAPLLPKEGFCIAIPGDGDGKIISVKRQGKLFYLHVLLESGKQRNLLFKPGKMTISKA